MRVTERLEHLSQIVRWRSTPASGTNSPRQECCSLGLGELRLSLLRRQARVRPRLRRPVGKVKVPGEALCIVSTLVTGSRQQRRTCLFVKGATSAKWQGLVGNVSVQGVAKVQLSGPSRGQEVQKRLEPRRARGDPLVAEHPGQQVRITSRPQNRRESKYAAFSGRELVDLDGDQIFDRLWEPLEVLAAPRERQQAMQEEWVTAGASNDRL